MDDSGYTTIKDAGRTTGAMRGQPNLQRGTPPTWLRYFKIQRADIVEQKVERLGRPQLAHATEFAFGRSGLVTDPQNAELAVLESNTDIALACRTKADPPR